ncbi:NAD-dependent epimerase/dehydratase family protein [Devosia sp. J2-20]|uniref:NAD-dependent epimerase/dehydratase family protein n=1 Tax=Devosia sp. J2-20 TaxID=3026161 RepID=UPI00249C1EA5|nr:NAD-dependent epimerase/dehydratase family protein [Devosia sp. J2-20]WDQ99860.1 NAD-dependent epimerase/dehydratase family protein [Devosia sp. J2-20]
MSKGKVTVLGSNGHIGHAAMLAFRDAGWDVTGLGRSNRRPVGGTHFIAGNADHLGVVRDAIADADVVVHALHLPYDQWGNGRAEAQLQVVIDALGDSGKTLLFPGTIYNYRANDRTVSPATRQSAEAPRGEIRIALEAMLRAAAAERRFQAIILRAGDFYGPGNRGEWFEQAMLMNLGKGQIHHMGDLALRHSWAYLPDLARAFVVLAERRAMLDGFENFHFAGNWISHGQMMDAIAQALDRPVTVSPMPWWVLRAIGLVNPVMRDIYRMRYLWLNEMELVDPRLDAIVGPDFATPFGAAVAATVGELIESRKAA